MPTLDELIKQKTQTRGMSLQGLIDQKAPRGPLPLLSLGGTVQLEQANRLLKGLRGRVPSQGPLPQVTRPVGGTFGGSTVVSGQLRRQEVQRRDSFKRLLDLGFTTDEIVGALAFEEAIKPPSKLPQTAGSIAATIALSKAIPGPADDIALGARLLRGTARTTAAGLGAVAGKALQDIADPDADFNFERLLPVFGEEAAIEAVTLGLSPVAKKIIGGAKRTAIEGGQRLGKRLTEAGRKIGIKTRFLPAQFSENQLIDTLQGIGENSLVGSNTIFQFKRGQLKAATSLVDELSETISRGAKNRSLDEMASLTIDAVEDRGLAHSVTASKLFGAVDVASVGAKVDLRPVKNLAKDISARAARAGNIGQTDTSLNMLKRLTDDIDDLTSFETAQDIRSGLLDILRKGQSKVTPDPKSVGIVKRITPEVDAAMSQAARNAGPEVEPLWRRANQFWKAGRKRFNNKLINKLMRDLPERPEVITKVFRPGGTKTVLRVKKAVGAKTFQELKGTYIEHIVRESSKIDPSALAGAGDSVGNKILKQFNGLGDSTLKVAFTPTEIQAVQDSARILGLVQAKTGGQAGALRFVQGTALAGIVAAPFIPGERVGEGVTLASGVLLLGPAVLSRLMVNPKFARLLSEGFKAKAGTQQAVALGARLARNVLQARREINRERRKKQLELERQSRAIRPAVQPQQLRGFGGRGF